jgi:hypothetical protein
MKAAASSSPALCQLPLIDSARSTTNDEAQGAKWHPAGFLVRMAATIRQAIISQVPVGYEDETGFHFGVAKKH